MRWISRKSQEFTHSHAILDVRGEEGNREGGKEGRRVAI